MLLLLLFETKLLLVSTWAEMVACIFFDVAGGVLGISRFGQWIKKGGWEFVEAFAGKVPILINLLLQDSIVDWLKQLSFFVKQW